MCISKRLLFLRVKNKPHNAVNVCTFFLYYLAQATTVHLKEYEEIRDGKGTRLRPRMTSNNSSWEDLTKGQRQGGDSNCPTKGFIMLFDDFL
jgi:hypothetical protein